MSRKKILDILGKKCISCGSRENLHIHHKLPYWLWRYVGETDKGDFSTKFIDNYEVVCDGCHSKRHDFINENLYQGFRSHYAFQVKWNRTIGRKNPTNFTYVICVDEFGWCSLGFPESYLNRLGNLPPPFQVQDHE